MLDKCLIFSDYRDQGLTRPKVLIVLPFRNEALRVVDLMAKLLMTPEQVKENLVFPNAQPEYSN